MKTAAYGAADAMIILPAAIPLLAAGKELAAGHSVSYAVNTATNMVAGVMPMGDSPDMNPDFGKITKYAIASVALVALGLGMRKFVAKRI